MFLKSLSLKGFKSFADPAVLEFEPGITVVVGPNGSGKSNVVDAVAWVLGAQGPRTLRSAKMEDVIFMGTANRPALGRAEVTLTIDNSAGKLATDLAEITITRTLFRSGDSEYSINGAPCRLLDIQELLSDTGVGRQQHVIISQGHLDAILEARPEDRRAVIEEAAGVLKYRRRRERSERRLASTEENLERLFDLVREVKRQIRPLERQAAAARSYTGLSDELRAVRLFVAGTELRALDQRHAQGTQAQTELTATEARLGNALTLLDADTDRTADEMSAQRESDLASALGRSEGMVERARGLSGVLRERQRSLAQALDAAADADVVSTLESEGARLAGELEATETEMATLAPDQDAVAAAELEATDELHAHLDAWGDGAELRQAEEAVTVAEGRSAPSSTRSSATVGRWPSSPPASPPPSAGPDSWRARTTSWVSGSPRPSRPATTFRPWSPKPNRPTGVPSAGWTRPSRRSGRPNRSWPAPPPGRTPSSGPWTRPEAQPGPSCWPGSTEWWARCSMWSTSMPDGRRRSRLRWVPRWPRWWCPAASRPRPHCPGSDKEGPPAPCWP